MLFPTGILYSVVFVAISLITLPVPVVSINLPYPAPVVEVLSEKITLLSPVIILPFKKDRLLVILIPEINFTWLGLK